MAANDSRSSQQRSDRRSRNRLADEQSPYLLQHAGNPVDWYPWNDDAFVAAQARDVPVFLSVGYSTCHWCHVMEHESFEDSEVAKLLNDHFVCIKVDREERPDIDSVYMTVTQRLTGSGGWPMTVIMTPDKQPFFAGTYFPKHGRYDRPGMMDLLPQIAKLWHNERDKITQSAQEITREIVRVSTPSREADDASRQTFSLAQVADGATYRVLEQAFDHEHGGFGGAPKFPTPHTLTFLLRYAQKHPDSRALQMVETTLTLMRRGGIFDHVGFGFHRYSTDRQWLVPHFEKMLYDQALIALAYLQTYQATGAPGYAATVREIHEYVLRDLTDPAGGLYSAEDADSEGVEGQFYLWSKQEIEQVLGDKDAAFWCAHFHIKADGNFTDEITGRRDGRNIPHRTQNIADEATAGRLHQLRRELFRVREQRVHPFKDDKVLTDWNGLMIAALAASGRVLDEPRYSEAARRAADFILTTHRAADGDLLKRSRGGNAGLPAHLEDYAFMSWGLYELYRSSFDLIYLQRAVDLTDRMIDLFWDTDAGALFATAHNAEQLLFRAKEAYDGAIPSGNSIAALVLVQLYRTLGTVRYREKAEQLLSAFTPQLAEGSTAYCQLIQAAYLFDAAARQIVIVGPVDRADTQALLQVIERAAATEAVLIKHDDRSHADLAQLAPHTRDMRMADDKATAYVCEDFVCRAPTTDPATLERTLLATVGRSSD